MWRCTECSEMGDLGDGFPDSYPNCGAPREAVVKAREDCAQSASEAGPELAAAQNHLWRFGAVGSSTRDTGSFGHPTPRESALVIDTTEPSAYPPAPLSVSH